jgi:hypothetical protein
MGRSCCLDLNGAVYVFVSQAHSRRRLSPEGLAAMKAGARQPKRCAGGGDHPAARRHRAATASIKTRHCSPLGGPTTQQLFFGVL